MSIKKFEKVIATVLRQSVGQKRTVEQVAAMIVARVDEVESILADVGIEIPSFSVPGPAKQQDWGSVSEQVNPGPVDISSRLTPNQEVTAELVERWTKERLQSFAINEMPSHMPVRPPGFADDLTLEKHVESAPGDLAYVRVTYQPIGNPQQVAPSVQISSTDLRLDAEEHTREIRKQAEAMFSKTPRVLTPKFTPMQGSLGDLTNGIGVDLDTKGTERLDGALPGGIDPNSGRVIVGEFGQAWKNQGGR